MNRPKTIVAALLAVLTIAGIQTRAVAQEETTEERPKKIAKARAEGTTVKWDVKAPYSTATLTISTPEGDVIRKEFPSGTAPVFSITSGNENLPDGIYNYELRFTPAISEEVKKSLKESRDKGNDAETVRALRKRGQLPTEPLVESGSFSILNGKIIVSGAPEPRGQRKVAENQQFSTPFSVEQTSRIRNHHLSPILVPDQVIPDDLIVQGSLCVGFDCVNNEDFGFDTIRLKENNLRIKFDDTSTIAGYPNRDWQIIANDSASGGANSFSVEDTTGAKVPFIISANAATNSIFVDSTGRLGLRTSTPVLDVHANTSNTPAIRLEQNASGGWGTQTWDIAGNEANFFIRDVTTGSKLPFRIRPGAPTSSLDISATGNVGIGTASPDYKLEVIGGTYNNTLGVTGSDTVGPGVTIKNTGASGREYNLLSTGTAASPGAGFFAVFDQTAGGAAGYRVVINASGNVGIGTIAPTDKLSVNGTASKPGGGSWAVFSDERLKTIKGFFNRGLGAVMQLQPLRYEYKPNNALKIDSKGEQIGFGAQSLRAVIPEAVTTNDQGYLMVNNDPIIWTMLNAIKEQQKEIAELRKQVRQLQGTTQTRRHGRRR